MTSQKPRLLSLDVMRGVTIAAMTLVNNPGDWEHIYAPLEHSRWDGCTPTDMIFPFFLFMVGVSVVYAMETKKADAANHGKMIWGALRRMALLIVISWFIQLFYHHSISHLRLMGVLPRIAIVFFICSILYIKTSQKTRDWVLAGSLIGYYVIINFIPVPGYGAANLNPETNFGAWLDRLLLGTNHLWAESKTWDPEGILGTLPAIGTCLLGIHAGTWLKRSDREDSLKVTWLFVFGTLAIIAGLVWGMFFPINKALWTSSFVLYTGGLAIMALALSYWLIDVQGRKKYIWVFVVFGMNAITAYVLGDLLQGMIDLNFLKLGGNGITAAFYHNFIAPYFNPYNASLVRAIIYLILTWLPMLWLYKKKIYIKV